MTAMIDNNKVEYLCRLIDRLDDCDKYTDACDEAIEVIGQYIKILEQPASPGWKEFKRDMYNAVAPPQHIACEGETESQHIDCEGEAMRKASIIKTAAYYLSNPPNEVDRELVEDLFDVADSIFSHHTTNTEEAE